MEPQPAEPEHVVDLMKAGFQGMVDHSEDLVTMQVAPGETQVVTDYATGVAAAGIAGALYHDTFVMLQLTVSRYVPADDSTEVLTHTVMMTRAMAAQVGAGILSAAMDPIHAKRSI